MITWTERAKASISKMGQGVAAKTDETPIPRLLAVSSVPTEAVSPLPERLSSVLTVPPPAVLGKCDSSIAVIGDLDRWCWPHSSVMNGAEIDTFTARLFRFNDKGLPRNDGETLADKLVIRDRESDDRCVCLECVHLTGHWASSWRCGNWKAASAPHQSSDAQLASVLVLMRQRCDGFAAQLKSTQYRTCDDHIHLARP